MTWLVRALVGALLALSLGLVATAPAHAGTVEFSQARVESADPRAITWRVRVNASAGLQSAELVYRVYNPGGNVGGSVRAEVSPGTMVDVSATLTTRSAERYIPAGTRFSYWWEVVDRDGVRASSDPTDYVFLDGRYQWQSKSNGEVTVYWYGTNEPNADLALQATTDAIRDMERLLKVELPYPVTVLVWRRESDADLAQPPRALSFDQQVITGGSRVGTDLLHIYDALGNFVDVARHEAAHIVTKVAGDGPFTSIPSWLDEGTAVYAQNDPGAGYQFGVRQAINRDATTRLRAMQSSTNRPDQVDIFYGQSWSTVKFMIDEWGEDKFAELYAVVKGGEPIDRALLQVYEVDQDGLYNLWRQSVGLQPIEYAPQAQSTQVPGAEATRPPLGIPTGGSSQSGGPPAAAPDGSPGEPSSPTLTEGRGGQATTAIIIGLITLLIAGGLGAAGFRMMRSR